jgi:hypothetical protein
MTENGTAPAPPDDDRTPTQQDEAPPTKPANEWVMPEPVFRRSSGYTPRVFAGNDDPTIVPDTVTTLEIDPADDAADAAEPASAAPLIAEQPDVVAEDNSGPLAETAPPVKKGGFVRLLLIILGFAIVLGGAILAVVLGILWYLSQTSDSQNLN